MARIAVLRKDRCSPAGCGGYLCMKVCPINRTGRECIVKGLDGKPVIDEALCTGCGICPKRCPFGAISIINLPEELSSDPIHRYGPNGFALYGLPMPLFGRVVGIMGRNGIGKTTAIRILAAELEPNLGTDQGQLGRLMELFKGTEMQVFFQRRMSGSIRAAYKPQNIDMLSRAEGRVRDLLARVDERGRLAEFAQALGIEKVLDNSISTLSGGELQRVAIAATVLKKAGLYIFDEPTSYLDIRQRLLVSGFIKRLADDETAVIVIEHDLIALDYMADLVHIMYGDEDCYGVVSQPKQARLGMNVYLEGFLKEENVRFRDQAIKFDVKPPLEKQRTAVLAEWPEFSVKLGRFTLDAEPGTIHRHDTVGVLGENGIGKTTFVRALAGLEKPKVSQGITMAYKPQQLEAGPEPVASFLASALSHMNDIIKPLDLEPLLNRTLAELSGGQLQRVYIAKALAEKADLILLDEPSAYLDIEQRLQVSRLIRSLTELRGVSALVVDHDLVFLDYLSNRLLVFDGSPAERGRSKGPFEMEKGMNMLLSRLGITIRRDHESGRPRINKPGSRKDEGQKKADKHYYT